MAPACALFLFLFFSSFLSQFFTFFLLVASKNFLLLLLFFFNNLQISITLSLVYIFLYKLWWWFIIIHIFIYTYIYYLYIIYIYTVFFIYISDNIFHMLPYIFFSLVVLVEKLLVSFEQSSIFTSPCSVPWSHVDSSRIRNTLVCSLPGCNSFFFLFFSPVLLHVSTLFVTLSSRFFLFFPSKFHQIFLLFHEIACVHFLDSLNISFSSPLHFVFVFFWEVNQVKGISVTDPSADPFCVYSLFLSCSRRCFRFESRFEIELSIQLCASTIWVRFRFRFIGVCFVDFSRLLICTQEGIHRIVGFF